MDEELVEILAREIPRNGLTGALGFELVSLDENGCTLRMTVSERHLNLKRVVHGGALAALCDAALGLAFVPIVRVRGMVTATSSLTVEFIAKVPAETPELRASGRVLRAGTSTGFGEAEVYAADKLVAKALGTVAMVPFE